MTTPFTYDFGYSWGLAWGHLVPLGIFGLLAAAGVWLGWRRSLVMLSAAVAAWAVAGLLITHYILAINLPVAPDSERFMASGGGRVVDIGAGSGRATIGLLLARPQTTATGVDLYRGYFGIDGNTPERLLDNARRAGVAHRVDAQVGDARDLPLPSDAYDGAISVAVIDHLSRADMRLALAEAARVLKPGGQFLLTVVRVDGWVWFASPHALAHHRLLAQVDWPELLRSAGFEVLEQGTAPARRYFLGRKVGFSPANGADRDAPRDGGAEPSS